MVRLHVVLVRCDEQLGRVLNQLQSFPDVGFTIYQKESARCGKHHKLPSLLPPNGAVRSMSINLGRECSGYLQYLYDEYERLPRLTAFLQWNAEMHMPVPLSVTIGTLRNFTGGFVALSKNSFEGRWPAPCEPKDQSKALRMCADHYWQAAAGSSPSAMTTPPAPTRFRFYANGLFAVARERLHRHPRSLYKLLLDRMLGRAPLACLGGAHHAFASWTNSSGLVRAEADCLMLEKMWHIFFGEEPALAPPDVYNEMRFPAAARSAWGKYGQRPVRTGRNECPEIKEDLHPPASGVLRSHHRDQRRAR